jgi:hypothetical protein
MDSAPYHSTVHNKPGKYANKQDMVDWLQADGCLADISMRKIVLYDFVEKLMSPKKKKNLQDQIFNVHGHAFIRFPPYMCDINPIELAWAKLKNLNRINSVSGDINMNRLQELVLEATLQISREDREGYCRHVEKLEE